MTLVLTLWNAGPNLDSSIDSLSLLRPLPDEAILLNDASTDETCQRLPAIAARLPFPTTLVCLRNNLGVAGVRNLGLELATSDVVVLADSDDQNLPDRLRIHAELFARYPEAWVSVAGQERAYGSGIRRRPDVDFESITRSATDYAKFVFLGESAGVRELELAFPASSMALRRRCALSVGGFDPSLKRVEDVDFCLRVLSAGGSVVSTSELGVRRNLEHSSAEKTQANAEAELELIARHGFLLAGRRERSVAKAKIRLRRDYLLGRRLLASLWASVTLLLSPVRQGRVLLRAGRYRRDLSPPPDMAAYP